MMKKIEWPCNLTSHKLFLMVGKELKSPVTAEDPQVPRFPDPGPKVPGSNDYSYK